MRRKEKWIIVILLAIMVLILMAILNWLDATEINCDPDFFFNKWEIVAVFYGTYPYMAMVLKNPVQGHPQKVKVFCNLKEQTIDGYAYLENGEFKVFAGPKYEEVKKPLSCAKCHPPKIPT